jgi:hypothetical protein
MTFRGNNWLYKVLMMAAIVTAFAGVSNAQITVSISGEPVASGTPLPNPLSTPAPSGSFKVKATPAVVTGSVSKIVFYRNDVPYKTLTSTPWEITEDQLGQDKYTYHARAYHSGGTWAESGDFVISVETARVFTMGDAIPLPSPLPSPSPTPYVTHGPDPDFDHTQDIREAVAYLSGQGGGTLFFPCTPMAEGYNRAIYNISDTITIPSNVTLQGEGSEWWGKCVIFWYDIEADYKEEGGDPPPNCSGIAPENLRNKPMFQIAADTHRVRIRDLALHSRASGPHCYIRDDFEKYFDEQTSGIELNPDADPECEMDPCGGNISDVIFENVTISDFTNGIKAVSLIDSTNEISDIKIRGYQAHTNYRQLFIDAPVAYDWDVQNMNIVTMVDGQGGVEIVNAGEPSEYTGDREKLKFLQLNCIGNFERDPEFCVQIEKHGGLYFRQLHQEGVHIGFIVKDLTERDPDETNTEPIVVESSIATGEFYDAGMKLYLISNAVVAAPEAATGTLLEDGRLEFFDAGVNSTVVDCGDYHRDFTDTGGATAGMLFTHSERNRTSFFAHDGSDPVYTMPHVPCPRGVSEITDIDKIGGEFFDSGVLPNEPGLYSNALDPLTCPPSTCADIIEDILLNSSGSLYINGGTLTVDRTVTIPKGSQIIGDGSSGIELDTSSDDTLLRIEVFIPNNTDGLQTGIVLRNLELKTEESGKTGIHFIGDNSTTETGVSRDMQFSGLTFTGFEKGIYASPFSAGKRQPMVDGLGLKDMKFDSDATAIEIFSSNASNWNVMNLVVTPSMSGTLGWDQTYGGHLGLQDVRCRAAEEKEMEDCLRLRMVSGFFLSALKKTVNTGNAVTIMGADSAQHSLVNFRNNDFTGSTFNVLGESFITSMNNMYGSVNVGTSDRAEISRLTHCGDSVVPAPSPSPSPTPPPFPELEDYHPNNWVGTKTPTRTECGTRPVPWDDPVKWGGASGDVPLTGKFYDDDKGDLVIFRPGATPEFQIKKRDVPNVERIIPFGITGDIPFVGKFVAGDRDQLLVFQIGASPATWRMLDPNDCTDINDPGTCTTDSWSWGTWDDIPLIGNFIDDADDLDEIAVYRPSNKTFYIIEPRSPFGTLTRTTTADNDTVIVVGDFQGLGYDQIAQYDTDATWYILDPSTGTGITAGWGGASGDIPVTGRYLPPAGSPAVQCSQLGIWREGDQKLYIADATSGCGSRVTNELFWGSSNGAYSPDIPLTISDDGLIDRPVSYRPAAAVFPYITGNGQWWIHDKF